MEFGQWDEWKVKGSLDWHLVDSEKGAHAGLQNLLRDLNRLYRTEPAFHKLDLSHEGFQWIDFHDRDQNVLCQLRRARAEGGEDTVISIFNFSPQPYHNYRVGVPLYGYYEEILNTDSVLYGGENVGNDGGRQTEAIPAHNFQDSVGLTLPPLGALFLKLGTKAV
jgi:1,4-alpha-glucan branching enzyme